MRRSQTGIRLWKGGRQAYIQVNGHTYSKTFPLTEPLEKLREWREDQRTKYAKVRRAGGSFAADIEVYLSRVAAMSTLNQRRTHLELWAAALGRDRPRHSITSTEIDAVMQRWLSTPSNQPDPDVRGRRGRPSAPSGLAPATVRKRRTALLSLFVKLDGKTASNPVRGTFNPQGPEAEARGADYATLARVFAAMPDYRDTKKGQPKKPNLAKVRASVIAYTGVAPGELMKVTRADVNIAAKTVRLPPRRKGKGAAARTLHLSAPALEAFRALIAADAFCTFAPGPVNVSFKRACRRVDVTGLHLYDLRHSYGAELYRQTGDLPTVGRALGHAPGSKVTHRYTKAAHEAVDAAAADKMGAAITAGRNLSLKPVRARKSRKGKELRHAS
jgi:integrase